MSRLSEADVQKSCKPKDAATEGFCFQQTMIRVKVSFFIPNPKNWSGPSGTVSKPVSSRRTGASVFNDLRLKT